MHPVRIIAMAAPNGVNFRSVGRSTATADITPSIAAAMCAGLPELWWAAARLKWAGDTGGVLQLAESLQSFTTEQASRGKWRIRGKESHLVRMVELSILEMAQPGKWREDQQRATYIGMNRHTFYKLWRGRYEIIYRQLESWADSALSYIKQRNAA